MRLRAILVTALVLVLGAATPVPAIAREPALRAKTAVLVEASTGDVLLSRNSHQRRPMASTTKLMTALVALERDDLDDVFSATDYAAAPAESQLGLRTGERMSVRDLLRASLLPSANDAAATLAVGTLGTQRAFVAAMNRRAGALGLRDTSYANSVGLDEPGNFSSAYDLARLAIRLRRNEFFRRTVDLPRALLRSSVRKRTVLNRNPLVRSYGYVDGVKTGHTRQAGYVLVGSATRHGVNVISVVMGDPSERARNEDSLALLRYGLRSYRARTILPEGRVVGHTALKFRDGQSVPIVAGATFKRVLRVGEHASVSITGLPSKVDGPLPRGSRVGTAVVRSEGRVLKRLALVTARPVAEAGLGDRLNDFVGRSLTWIAIVALVVCSLPLMALRNRVVRRQHALEDEQRRAGRGEQSPTP